MFLTFTHRPIGLGMYLLMTEEVNQYQVAVAIVAPKGSSNPVVNLEFFIVEKRFKLSFEALKFLFDEYLFEALMNHKCRTSTL